MYGNAYEGWCELGEMVWQASRSGNTISSLLTVPPATPLWSRGRDGAQCRSLDIIALGAGALGDGEDLWEHRAGSQWVGEDSTEEGTVELGF